MSIEHVARVLNGASDLDATAKLVLLGIANHDGDGGAWPSIATLCRYANCSESTVHRAIKRLVEAGYVEVETNAGGTHQTRHDRRPNLYTVDYRLVIHSRGQGGDERGVTHDTPCPDGVSSDAPRGVTAMTPEPSITTLVQERDIVQVGGGGSCVEDGCPNEPRVGRWRCDECQELLLADLERDLNESPTERNQP